MPAGILTFGYTDLEATRTDDGLVFSTASTPAFRTAGDVTFSTAMIEGDDDVTILDSTTAGFGVDAFDSGAGFALTTAEPADGSSSALGSAVINIFDMDGDAIVVSLLEMEGSPFSFASEFQIVGLEFVAAAEGNTTFDGADGGSFEAAGLSVLPIDDQITGGVTVLPDIDAPLDVPYLVQGFVVVQIPAPASMGLAGAGLLLAVRRRRGGTNGVS